MGILLCVWFGCGFTATIFCLLGDIPSGQITVEEIIAYILLTGFGCLSLLIAGFSYIADHSGAVIWKKKKEGRAMKIHYSKRSLKIKELNNGYAKCPKCGEMRNIEDFGDGSFGCLKRDEHQM